MGHHLLSPGTSYRRLQQRLDRNVTGAPESPQFREILKLLFTREEAELAQRVPTQLTSVARLAERLGLDPAPLEDRLTRMAAKGLVFDVEHEGRRYFSLSPVVIGFFELTFMRAGDDVPRAELARLFEEYFFAGDGRFAKAVFEGETQLGRSLVRESSLPKEPAVEILDWERASRIVEEARTVAVSLCACRHHAQHLGRVCDRPLRACMSFDSSAETLQRTGHAEKISNAEGLRILAECQGAGLAQTADNVRKGVGYICNCCGCCCGMMTAIRRFGIPGAIVSSNWIAEVNEAQCSGCGLCVKACPAEVLELEERPLADGRKPKKAVRDESACLGCGVCVSACKRGALEMKVRPARVFTPETTFDRIVTMAIERGKLADLMMEDPENLTFQALGRILAVLEAAPPWKAAIAIKPLKSVFLGTVLPLARWGAGGMARVGQAPA